MSDDFRRLEARTAAEVCRRFSPTPEAQALLTETETPGAYLERLAAAGQFGDAEAFLAHALPKREAVWWACLCVRRAVGASPAAEVAAALAAAEAWAAAPGDVNRRKALPAAEAAGYGHPAGCAALAAFLSGGSLAPPALKEVPPAEHLTASAVAGAVQTAAVLTEPEAAAAKHRQFLELGFEVARGTNRWKDRL